MSLKRYYVFSTVQRYGKNRPPTIAFIWHSVYQTFGILKKSALCPEFLFPGFFHFSLALGTGLLVPYTDVITATLQTEATYLASVRRSHIGNDTTHHNVLDSLAVRAEHGRNLLTEQTTSLIHLGLVAAGLTAIFQFPCHLFNSSDHFNLNQGTLRQSLDSNGRTGGIRL